MTKMDEYKRKKAELEAKLKVFTDKKASGKVLLPEEVKQFDSLTKELHNLQEPKENE